MNELELETLKFQGLKIIAKNLNNKNKKSIADCTITMVCNMIDEHWLDVYKKLSFIAFDKSTLYNDINVVTSLLREYGFNYKRFDKVIKGIDFWKNHRSFTYGIVSVDGKSYHTYCYKYFTIYDHEIPDLGGTDSHIKWLSNCNIVGVYHHYGEL